MDAFDHDRAAVRHRRQVCDALDDKLGVSLAISASGQTFMQPAAFESRVRQSSAPADVFRQLPATTVQQFWLPREGVGVLVLGRSLDVSRNRQNAIEHDLERDHPGVQVQS